MATSSGRVPMLDETGRFPDRFAPPSVVQDAAAAVQAKLDAVAAAGEAAQVAEGMPAQAAAAVTAEVVARVDPKVTAAQDAQQGAQAASGAAAQERTAAEAAAARAEAVGDTNDTIMAAKIKDTASATGRALSAASAQLIGAIFRATKAEAEAAAALYGVEAFYPVEVVQPINVTATPPTFTDLDGTGSDTFTIPAMAGVDYTVDGSTKAMGTYPASGTVVVTASAQAGHVLTGTAAWSHTFSSAAATTYIEEVLADSPTNFLQFEGSTADTGSAAATWTPAALTYGSGLDESSQAGIFDGATTKVTTPTSSDAGLSGTAAFTVEAIVKFDATATNQKIFDHRMAGFIDLTARKLRAYAWAGGVAVSVSSSVAAVAGVATHVAMTYDGANLTIYVNGAAGGSTGATGVTGTATSPLTIGVQGQNSTEPFGGSLDGFALYRGKALTAGRILAHATAAGLA